MLSYGPATPLTPLRVSLLQLPYILVLVSLLQLPYILISARLRVVVLAAEDEDALVDDHGRVVPPLLRAGAVHLRLTPSEGRRVEQVQVAPGAGQGWGQ